MSDEAPKKVEIPGVWKLGWMLFMQPRKIYDLHRTLGEPKKVDVKLHSIWSRGFGNDCNAGQLLLRYLVLIVLWGACPLLQFQDPLLVRLISVPLSIPLAIAFSYWMKVEGGLAEKVSFCLAMIGVLWTVPTLAVPWMPRVLHYRSAATPGAIARFALSFWFFGLLLGNSYTLRTGEVDGTTIRQRPTAVMSLLMGFVVAAITGYEHGVVTGIEFGLAVVIGFSLGVMRVVDWVLCSSWTRFLWFMMQRQLISIGRLSRLLPFRVHDSILYPIWGLREIMVEAAEKEIDYGLQFLVDAIRMGQWRTVGEALAELQARSLEAAARHDGFLRAADLDLPFFVKINDIPPNDPLLTFQAVAKDVTAGGANQRLRRQTLERARERLLKYLATPLPRESSALGHRLNSTAKVWLDVVEERIQQLALEMRARPQVPLVFVAGPPLMPGTADGFGLFKGRRDLARVLEQDLSPGRRGVLLVVGQRRMGKSSFAHWLPRLLGTGTTVVRVDFQGLGGEPLRAHPHRVLVDAIARTLPDVAPPPTSDSWANAMTWLSVVEKHLGSDHLLVVVDEFEKVEEGIRKGWCDESFLDFARAVGDRLQQVRLLLLGARPLSRLGTHWPDRLISATVRPLGPLDETTARELITRPVDDFPSIYPDGGVEKILSETGGHPYLIQKVCDDLCQLLNERGGQRSATPGELEEVFDKNADLTLFNELWASRSREERAVLRALADASDVIRGSALEALVREGFVVREETRERIAVPMFSRWIANTMPPVEPEAPTPIE